MITDEQRDAILKAIELVKEAQDLVDSAAWGSDHVHYYVYGRYGFDQLLGNGNLYDSSLYSLLEDAE